MAYLKFLDTRKIHKVTVVPNENIVTLEFKDEKVVNTSGFNLFLDAKCEVDIGGNSYHGYTTIYRNDSETDKYNGYQLSNDGSVYIPPEPAPEPEPYEPTLEELKKQKIAEMNQIQQSVIQNGVEVTLSDGSTERFTLKDQDQISLMGLQTLVAEGMNEIPWHEADNAEHCKYYSAEDMTIIAKKAIEFVTFHVTWFRDLRIYIMNGLNTAEEVNAITYDTYIPSEYRSEVLNDMMENM